MRVGIDLGTTFCAVAKIDERTGRAVIIKNALGKPITPSVLYFGSDGKLLHGEEAKDYYEAGDPDTAAYFKYKMGDADFKLEYYGKTYLAEDLSTELLKGVIREAEESCGESIDEAIITVPAYFEHPQREATIRAGEKAGVRVLGIINEPTAAVFAYGINGSDEKQKIMIYDLGGGTFDITIAEVTGNDIRVLGSDGDHELGGRDWDHAILDYFAELFYDEYGIRFDEDLNFINRMRCLAEKTKMALTVKKEEKVTIYYQGKSGQYTLTSDKFREISETLVERTEFIIDGLMEELSIGWDDIDGVILVGGSTRMKMIHDFVERMSGKKPYTSINPDQAVALGAAIRANIDENGKPIKPPREFLIAGKRETEYKIAGAKSFHEATAHSLGMIAEDKAGEHYINNIMIRKNSPVPAEYAEKFTLRVGSRGEKPHLDVYMLQGETEELAFPLNATCLGKYVFSGIRDTGKKEEEITVTYRYSGDSVVSVQAVQESTHQALELSIESAEEDMSWVLLNPQERVMRRAADMDIVLAIDLSGSMSSSLGKVKAAAKEFVRQFNLECTRVGIVGFASQKAILQDMSASRDVLFRAINAMEITDELGYGTSAIPFDLAVQLLNRGESIRYVLVLTDGVWGSPYKAIEKVKGLWKQGIETIAVGFGTANKSFLDSIASREEFAKMTDLAGLSEAFTGIAKKM